MVNLDAWATITFPPRLLCGFLSPGTFHTVVVMWNAAHIDNCHLT